MVLRGVLVTAGVLAAANALWALATTNVNSGVILQLALGVALVVVGLVGRLARSRWVLLPTLGPVAVVAIVSGLLTAFGLADSARGDEDAVVVLGAAVRGSEIGPALGDRLEVALDYHRRHPNALIVVTGGQGPQEDVPEAEAAAAYLAARGVPADRIVIENRSTSTAENFRYAKALLDQRLPPGYKIAFVTNEYHVWRAARTAAAVGFDATHLHSPTRVEVLPSAYLRESVAVVLAAQS